jgi:HEAT repeat protein
LEKPVVLAAIKATAKLGKENVINLLNVVLENRDADLRLAAAAALGDTGSSKAVIPLLHTLHDTDVNICRAALKSVGKINDASAVPILLSFLTDREIGSFVFETLLDLGEKGIPGMILGLSHRDTTIRQSSSRLLGWLKKDSAVSSLVGALSDPNPQVRQSAVAALTEIGATDEAELIRPLKRDEDELVRLTAKQALLKPTDSIGSENSLRSRR